MPLPGAEAPRLDVDTWLNSEPVELSEGAKIVDFWSSSCSDCARKAGFLQQLHDGYPVDVIGVHTPDLGFEREQKHVERAVGKLGVEYPVAHDPGRKAWRAYGNRATPRQYLVVDGSIEWHTAGGKSLEELEEAVASALDVEKKGLEPAGHDASTEGLGYRRCSGINGGANFRAEKTFQAPGSWKTGAVYLDGTWKQDEEYLEAVEDAKLFLPFEAEEIELVAGSAGGIKDIEVLLDGEPVSSGDAGEGLVLDGDRSYLRIKNPGRYSILAADTATELTLVPESGARLYTIARR